MYIKRQPLGQGNLAFSKRKKRLSFFHALAYVLILCGALYLYVNMRSIQPKVLSALGPPPAPTLPADHFITEGQAAYLEGNLAKAVENYKQAVALQPNDLDLMFTYARILTLNHNLTEAIAVADTMILLAPEDARGYAARSRALDWMGEYNQAQIEAGNAIALDPNNALAHAYLAEAYTDLGRLRQAREQAELALTLDPYSVDVRRNYALVLEYYGDYQGAISQYIQALQLEPNLLDLWYGLARNYRGAGQSDKSIETFAEIGKRTPNDPYLYVEWGKTYFEMRDDDAAQATLQQAIDLVCMQGQVNAEVVEADQKSCPFLTSDELFDTTNEQNPWAVPNGQTPLDSQLPWKRREEDLPPEVLITAWYRLGMVYNTRRNYEDAIAILSEAIAYAEHHTDKNDPLYVEMPVEPYYVLAVAYYYKDMCHFAIPLTVDAFQKYEREELDDELALKNILSLFVLCRDYTSDPESAVIHEGPGFTNGFPNGYEEPDVIIQNPNAETDDSSEESGEE